MHDFAVEQPGHGLEADVRMRRDVHRLAVGEGERPEAVEEAPLAPPAAGPSPEARAKSPDCRARARDSVGVDLPLRARQRDARFGRAAGS